MRNNDRSFSAKKNVVNDTPLFHKLHKALIDNSPATIASVNYKVVDASIIKGTTSTEFFLNKIW